nr:PD-(D/E)XK nuclease family protein [Halomicroarcula limicola]
MWDLETELETVGILDSQVTQSRVDDLLFYLDTFDVPFESSTDGVLLASATSSVYVDRPTVFYIGLDRSWERAVPERPWVDTAQEDALNLKRFQLLLQNGQKRHYFVVDATGGDPVTPCLYFEDLLDSKFDSFGDLPSTRHGGPSLGGSTPFKHDPPNGVSSSDPVTSLSQSTLRTLVNCPREYYISELVESSTDHFRQRGTAFHDVAELYTVAPEAIRTNREAVLNWLVDEQRPFLDQHDVETWRTTAAVGLDLLTDYLDDIEIEERVYNGYESFSESQSLATHLGQELESTVTEQRFENEDLGGHGVVDLVQDPTTLVDYKTGSQSTATSVLKDGAIENPSDTPNFQAHHYLAHHRTVTPEQPLSFRFVYFLDIVDKAVVSRDDVSVHETVTEVEYTPDRFSDYIGSESVYQWLWEDLAESNNRRKTLERMEYEPYAAFFTSHDYPDAESKDEVLDSPITSAFESHCVDHVGDYKYVRKGARSTMKKLFGLRNGQLFGRDLNEYETFLQTWINQVNEYRNSGFPVGDPNDDRLDHPLLIVGGDDQ